MKDTEIIKALECCKDNSFNSFSCEKCPYHGTRGCCVNNLCEDALALINRQKAEVELWQNEYRRACAERDAHIATTKFIRAEVVKEFAERLKKHSRKMQSSDFSGDFWDAAVLVEDIDNLVKEMEGESNGK